MEFDKKINSLNLLFGDISCQPYSSLPDIALRARVFLRSWTADRVVLMGKRIDAEIEQYIRGKEDGKSRPILPVEEGGNVVHMLKAIIEERDYRGNTEIAVPVPKEYPEGRDYELFAIVALGLLGSVLMLLENKRRDWAGIGEYSLQAMDAVCHAEYLYESAWLTAYVRSQEDRKLLEKQRKERSDRGRALNVARHKPREMARKLVTDEWYKARKHFQSAEAAGRHFADWLESQKIYKNNRREPYVIRTVVDWIRERAKETGFKFRP